MSVTAMIEGHKELVEVLKEHRDSLDALVDDDTNWIVEHGEPTHASMEVMYKDEFLASAIHNQEIAIGQSHEEISQLSSDIDDFIGLGAYSVTARFWLADVQEQLEAFFKEFKI